MTKPLVTAYNHEWQTWFEMFRSRFAEALQDVDHTIEHVGSTSILGMVAKPIIDIDIVIQPGDFPIVKPRLESLGYEHEGDHGLAGRESFGLKDLEESKRYPVHHTYVCEKGNIHLVRHLAFREFMRQHPEWVETLSALKLSFCEKHNNNRRAYMDGKEAMYEEIMALAMEAYK